MYIFNLSVVVTLGVEPSFEHALDDIQGIAVQHNPAKAQVRPIFTVAVRYDVFRITCRES